MRVLTLRASIPCGGCQRGVGLLGDRGSSLAFKLLVALASVAGRM